MPAESDRPALKQLTPVLVVDKVEPCLEFWVQALGFEVTNQVPDPNGGLVFASVQKGPIEIMYQTRASVVQDIPSAARDLGGHSVSLFITVDDLDAVEKAVKGAPVVKPRHDTFYGSTEIYVKEPGGNTVGFAQFT
ncbi:MAG TPA: VOC family protein [Gemmatimonadaceae bacterium]|nr:VOC family protein [Gemmatimonadaceae bacterium]